jgi:lysophospholipase L1-like esterase
MPPTALSLAWIEEHFIQKGVRMVSFAGSSRGVSVDLSAERWSYITRIMPLGDSITSGYKSSSEWGYRGPLWSKFYGQGSAIDFVGRYQDGPSSFLDPDHQGVIGETADGLVPLIPDLMTRYKPDVVLLMIGSSDIGDVGESPAQLRGEMKQILDQIAAKLPKTTVFVSTLTPLASDQPGSDQIAAANTEIRAVVADAAKKGQHVKLVEQKLTEADLIDGIHPNAGGYEKIAQAWYSAVTHDLPTRGGTPGGHPVALSSSEKNISGSEAGDWLTGDTGINQISGRGGNDIIRGNSGNDRLDGGSGIDSLNGGSGHDFLYGSSGNDRLIGWTGNDTLQGGTGQDLLTGSSGDDTFLFVGVRESGTGSSTRDVILDFRDGDTVDLSRIDASSKTAGNQAFHTVAHFTGSSGQLRWEKSGSGFLVSGDVNGDRNADFSIQVNTTLSKLHSWDFKF